MFYLRTVPSKYKGLFCQTRIMWKAYILSMVRGVLPNTGCKGVCGPKRYGFSAVLVINTVSILADFGHKYRVWFLYSSLTMAMLKRKKPFFIIIEKKINKGPSKIMLTVIIDLN